MKFFNLTLREDGQIGSYVYTYDENCNRKGHSVIIDTPEKLINIFSLTIKNNYEVFKKQVENLYKNLECIDEILEEMTEVKKTAENNKNDEITF